MMNRLADTLNFNAQALVLRAERQRLTASNIANADTPGYVARDFNFAQALREATHSASLRGPSGLQASDLSASATSARVQGNLLYAVPSQTNLDNNTVDMDRERGLVRRKRGQVRIDPALRQRPGSNDARRDEGLQCGVTL